MNGWPITPAFAMRSRKPIRTISADFNERMWQPGGFHRPIAARERMWKTKTGKANFIVPKSLEADLGIADERSRCASSS